MDGLLKSSLLRSNPWVQSPLCEDVDDQLKKLPIIYYQRGSGEATADLTRVIEKHRDWVSSIVDLNNFNHAYITSGATEAINHWRLSDRRPWQYIKGDYQYPQMLSGNGEEVEELISDKVLYISNPQCYDGNFVNLDGISNPVILDCAYIGATAIQKINVPVNTEQIMFSFSKGWGLIGNRCGLVYTKKPHKTLQPLKEVECYNYNAAPIIEMVMNNYTVDEMYNRYKDKQIEICTDHELTPSDTFFIATTKDSYYKRLRRKKDKARICLTPLLEERMYS